MKYVGCDAHTEHLSTCRVMHEPSYLCYVHALTVASFARLCQHRLKSNGEVELRKKTFF